MKFTKFDSDSVLTQELMNYTVHLGNYDTDPVTGVIVPIPVELEIKFPSDFPKQAPLFRFIRPKFLDTCDDDILEITLDENG